MFPDMPSEEINKALETSFGKVDVAASYLVNSKYKANKSLVFCNISILGTVQKLYFFQHTKL